MTAPPWYFGKDIADCAMAIHEAGHQLTAVALQVPSDKGVVLGPDSGRSFDSVGRKRRRFLSFEVQYWELLEKEIRILLAGECAVMMFYEWIGDDSTAYGSEQDQADLEPLLAELAESLEVSALSVRFRMEASVSHWLRVHRRFLGLLASELVSRRALSGAEVSEILHDLPPWHLTP